MSEVVLAYLSAALAWAAIIAYAVLGGADFGGGIWDMLASGPSREKQRQAIALAIGPVWEANNVWIIFVIVVTWTAFPYVYATVSTALFIPIAFALVGIVLRGAAFGFRAHIPASVGVGRLWGRVFSAGSVIAPFLLGTIAGALSSGHIRFHNGQVSANYWTTWTTPFSLACGAFALGLCSVLAATYLVVEAQSANDAALIEAFRDRAIISGAVTAAIGLVAAILAAFEAPILWAGLIGKALPLSLAAVLIGLATAGALLLGRYRAARILVAGEAVFILAAWAVALAPYLVVPDLTITNAASPFITLSLLLGSSVVGLALILPSLWFLLRVFKGRNPAVEVEGNEFYAEVGQQPADSASSASGDESGAGRSGDRPSAETTQAPRRTPASAMAPTSSSAAATAGRNKPEEEPGRMTNTTDTAATAAPIEQPRSINHEKAHEPPIALLLALAVGLQVGRTAWERAQRAYLRRRVRRRLRRQKEPAT